MPIAHGKSLQKICVIPSVRCAVFYTQMTRIKRMNADTLPQFELKIGGAKIGSAKIPKRWYQNAIKYLNNAIDK
jgi:hypothetical protein